MSAIPIVLSTRRFRSIRRRINRDGHDSVLYVRIETLFAIMLAVLLATLFVFLPGLARQ